MKKTERLLKLKVEFKELKVMMRQRLMQIQKCQVNKSKATKGKKTGVHVFISYDILRKPEFVSIFLKPNAISKARWMAKTMLHK